MTSIYAAIDVDGVVLDLVSYITDRLGLDPTRWTKWEFKESYDDPAMIDEFNRLIKRAPDMFVLAKPYPDARAAIQKLVDADIKFCFMSSFPPEFQKLREWWLWHYLVRPAYTRYGGGDLVHLMCVNSGYKANVCRTWGITHMLEDKPQTAIDCITKGIKAYIVPRVYNRPALDVPDATIDEFADMLIREARGN